jgi:uncharacterized membrane protein HdeD (DUF308 family)
MKNPLTRNPQGLLLGGNLLLLAGLLILLALFNPDNSAGVAAGLFGVVSAIGGITLVTLSCVVGKDGKT